MKKNITFAIGSGRCGTTFLHKLFNKHNDIASFHERYPNLETFYRYSKFNKLKIDEEPFFSIMEESIINDLKEKKISFESSNWLSFHVQELFKKFNCKFIVLLRNPQSVIESFIRAKDLYSINILKGNNSFAAGYQYYEYRNNSLRPHHNFSRLVPKNSKIFKKWILSPQKIKIYWYWEEVYNYIFNSLKKIPKNNYKIVKVEDLNYENYKKISKWIGSDFYLSEIRYKLINYSYEKNKKIIWTKKEKKLFNSFKSKINKNFYDIKFKEI